MTVGIKNEGPIIMGMIGAQAGAAIVAAACCKRCGMEGANRHAIGGAKAKMTSGGRHNSDLSRNSNCGYARYRSHPEKRDPAWFIVRQATEIAPWLILFA